MKIPKFLRRGTGKIIKILERIALRFSCVGKVDGIVIYDLATPDVSNSTFLRPTTDALKLIREVDPRRYRRVVRHIKRIVNRPLISLGTFERESSACNVDYNKQFTKSTPWNSYRFACLLVHEATHGCLIAKGLPYNDKTWEHIERLCSLEEYRFIRRFDGGWADIYRNPKNLIPSFGVGEDHRRSGKVPGDKEVTSGARNAERLRMNTTKKSA